MAATAGQPGKPLTAEDEKCLAPVPLRVFPADEICAARLLDLPRQPQIHAPDQSGPAFLKLTASCPPLDVHEIRRPLNSGCACSQTESFLLGFVASRLAQVSLTDAACG